MSKITAPITAAETSPTGYMTVANVAAELHIADIGVLRLHSLRLLPAAKRGEDGPLLVHANDLRDYIGRGCPGLTPPPMDNAWFDDVEVRFPHKLFNDKIIAALQDEIPSVRPDVANRVIPPTAAMLAAKGLPAPSPLGTNDPPVYSTLGLAFVVEELRNAARMVLTRNMLAGLTALYAGPDAFAASLQRAKDQFMIGQLSISAFYPAVEDAQVGSADSRPLAFSIGVRKSALFTQSDLTVAAALAF